MTQLDDLLKQHKLKRTEARLAVLSNISQAKGAVPYHDLEEAVDGTADRVTLYRMLKLFEEKGVLHKTIDHQGVSKYALCQQSCSEHKHEHDHVHFNCIVCNETTCLEGVVSPKISLPRGYKTSEVQVSINGVCRDCH